MEIEFLERTDPRRGVVERFVHNIYSQAHNASPDGFPALMAAAFSPTGEPVAAAGMRFAKDGFFSEYYLDAPLEEVAQDELGTEFPRDLFMEVTTLASARPAAMLALMQAMYRYGREHGRTCGVFTVTAPLRRLFAQLGIPLTPIASADQSRVPHPERWGEYYDADPLTCLCPDPGPLWTLRRARLHDTGQEEPLAACA